MPPSCEAQPWAWGLSTVGSSTSPSQAPSWACGDPTMGWPCPLRPPGSKFPAGCSKLSDSSCPFSSCQQLLPATGVPVTRRQFDHMTDMFDEYVKSRTLQNWKFWIVSLGFLCTLPPSPNQHTEAAHIHTLVPSERFSLSGCCSLGQAVLVSASSKEVWPGLRCEASLSLATAQARASWEAQGASSAL